MGTPNQKGVVEIPTRSAPINGGLTDKQEAFAQSVAEGMNYSAAYRQAYETSAMAPRTVWREACRLAQHEKVKARIAQLIAHRKEEHRVWAPTRAQRVTEHLEDMMANARTEGARIRAAELLGKTVGLFAERKAPEESRSVEELEEELGRLIKRSGSLN